MESGSIEIAVHNIREYSPLPHHEVDDTPYGGGPGMVTRVDIVGLALEGVFGCSAAQVRESRDVYVMSAGGRPFDHDLAVSVAQSERDLVLLCGRFEGFDARVEELFATGSLSDRPVRAGRGRGAGAGGPGGRRPPPSRLPGERGQRARGVVQPELDGMVEYPQYTRPREYLGAEVPPILLSGDHGAVARWRRESARPSPWGVRDGDRMSR